MQSYVQVHYANIISIEQCSIDHWVKRLSTIIIIILIVLLLHFH